MQGASCLTPQPEYGHSQRCPCGHPVRARRSPPGTMSRFVAVVCLLSGPHAAQAFTARPLKATMISRRRHPCVGPTAPFMSMPSAGEEPEAAAAEAEGPVVAAAGSEAAAAAAAEVGVPEATAHGEDADGGAVEPQARHWRLERARLDHQHSREVLRRKPRHLPYTGARSRCEVCESRCRCGCSCGI